MVGADAVGAIGEPTMAGVGADPTTVGADRITPATAIIGPTGVCITGRGITGPSTAAPIGGLLTIGPSIIAGLTGPCITDRYSTGGHIGGEALRATVSRIQQARER